MKTNSVQPTVAMIRKLYRCISMQALFYHRAEYRNLTDAENRRLNTISGIIADCIARPVREEKDRRLASIIWHLTHLNHLDDDHARRLNQLTARYNKTAARPSDVAVSRKTAAAYRPLVNHRAAAVGRMVFSDAAYTAAVRVAAGKVSAARRRAVTDNNNIYLQRWAETVHTAAVALIEWDVEAARLESLTPSGYEIDTEAAAALNEREYKMRHLYACRACGRWAYQEERRADEWMSGEQLKTLLDKTADQGRVDRTRQEKTAAPELMRGNTPTDRTEAAADRDYIESWKTAAVDAITHAKLSKRQKDKLLMTLDGKADQTDRPTAYRKLLDKLLTKRGLLTTDRRGHRMLEYRD